MLGNVAAVMLLGMWWLCGFHEPDIQLLILLILELSILGYLGKLRLDGREISQRVRHRALRLSGAATALLTFHIELLGFQEVLEDTLFDGGPKRALMVMLITAWNLVAGSFLGTALADCLTRKHRV